MASELILDLDVAKAQGGLLVCAPKSGAYPPHHARLDGLLTRTRDKVVGAIYIAAKDTVTHRIGIRQQLGRISVRGVAAVVLCLVRNVESQLVAAEILRHGLRGGGDRVIEILHVDPAQLVRIVGGLTGATAETALPVRRLVLGPALAGLRLGFGRHQAIQRRRGRDDKH